MCQDLHTDPQFPIPPIPNSLAQRCASDGNATQLAWLFFVRNFSGFNLARSLLRRVGSCHVMQRRADSEKKEAGKGKFRPTRALLFFTRNRAASPPSTARLFALREPSTDRCKSEFEGGGSSGRCKF